MIGVLMIFGVFFGIQSSAPVFNIHQAQAIDVGTSIVDQTIGLSGQDPRVIVAKIIRVALGLLGIMTVGFILYGGFVWMTANGEEDNVAKAKRILTNAVVGLAIILSAFAITQFVLSRLIEATGFGGGGGGGGGGCQGADCIRTLPPDAFVVRDISPQDPPPPQLWPRNTQVKIHMNQEVDDTSIQPLVDANTINNSIVVQTKMDQAVVPGVFAVEGSTVTFTPSEPCPAPNEDRFCFVKDTTFVVEVKPELLRSNTVPKHTVTCGGLANSCAAEFTVDNYVDTEPPVVAITVPSARQSIEIGYQTITAHAADDVAVSEIAFFDSGAAIPNGVASKSPPTTPYDGNIGWDTSQLPGESCRSLTARATDVDTNTATSLAVPVVIRPQHCFNGTKDDNLETGIDCGGNPLSIDYCGKCAGEACSDQDTCVAFCRSGACVDGHCVDIPRIDGFSHFESGAGPGSYITIGGEFFGSEPGAVYFLNGDGPDDDIKATLAPCAAAWSANGKQIVVQVPDDPKMVVGAIMVVTRDGKQDTSIDDRGFVGNFTPNTTQFPGICGIDPISEQPGAAFTLIGNGFGEIRGNSVIHFAKPAEPRDDKVVTDATWGAAQITGKVPTASAGSRKVYVTVSGNPSNEKDFEMLTTDTGSAPFIRTITPSQGPAGTYVTLSGANFGTSGQVIFTNATTAGTAIGATDFPEQCTDFWRDDEVTVKVPTTYSGGSFQGNDLTGTPIAQILHKIKIRRGDINGTLSNEVDFTVNGGVPPPGICGISPISGPVKTPVHFYGFGFGDAGNTVVRFFENKISIPGLPPTSHELVANVPDAASSGAVKVEVSNVSSNQRTFNVGDCRETKGLCGNGYECCINGSCAQTGQCQTLVGTGGYSWYISTGPIPQVPRLIYECNDAADPKPIPSPSPLVDRRGGNEVCVNAVVTGRFSIPMDTTTVDKPNFSFKSCTGEGADLTCKDDEQYTIPKPVPEWSGGTAFSLVPDALLPNTWYEIKLSTGMLGSEVSGHAPLSEDVARCGAGFAYCWRFKTNDGENLCKLTGIQVEPEAKTVTKLGQQVNYTTFGSTDVACIRIKTSNYGFSWSATKPAGHADIIGNPNNSSDKAIATAIHETVNGLDGPVDIVANVPAENINGTAQLTIDFTDPEIVSYWPNCPTACVDSGIGIKFNVPMDLNSILEAGRFTLAACLNESCQITNSIALSNLHLDPTGTILRADHPVLSANSYYRVVLSGLVQNTSNVLLTKTNYFGNYSWVFRTKASDVPCAVNKVEVSPKDAIVTVIGNRLPYQSVAYGAPDDCSVVGQELSSNQFNWQWQSEDINVATLIGNGRVDTKQTLPTGCSGQCLRTGARGVVGKVAVCGDSKVELGEECDDGNTNNGDGCSSNCLLEGAVGSAVCGNGGICKINADCQNGAVCSQVSFNCVELGEACDDGNTKNGDGCSDHCRLEGSVPGVAQCGNGSIGVGESCDDGNTAAGDGCSSSCLKEGSQPGPLAICGDGRVDAALGEECDGGQGCDPKICLHTGVAACGPGQNTNCCGNGDPNESGKDCDGEEGCSENCLKSGSSPFYSVPSFCGDGPPLGIGEECEVMAAGGDGQIDPTQIAEAVGTGNVVNGSQTTNINAIVENVTGTAPFVLQCGFKSDADCRDSKVGLGANTCCYQRPEISQTTPAANEGATAAPNGPPGVCRNPLISVSFTKEMDLKSFDGNVTVAKNVNGPCPANSTAYAIPATGAAAAIPGNWCVGGGIGTGKAEGISDPASHTSALYFQLTSGALDQYTWYRIIVVGDKPNDNQVDGVKSMQGVGMDAGANHNYEWYFKTGNDICLADAVGVVDTNIISPRLFTSAAKHIFRASALSTRGYLSAIAPIPGVYDWQWQSWTSSDTSIVTAVGTGADSANPNPADVTPAAPNKNGQTLVNASLKIITDEINKGLSTKDKIVSGSAAVEVFLCENPGLVIQDTDNSTTAGPGADAIQKYGNFTTRFCRDAGKPNNKTDDFSERIVQPVLASPTGILKEFVVRNPNYLADAIGFRLMDNPYHYSALRWYRDIKFRGDPQATTVDGFDAVRDGRTVYVSAPNIGLDGKLHSDIFIISYNEGATTETQAVFEQLLTNLHFLANLPNPGVVNTRFCVDGGGANIDGDQGKVGVQPISCSSNFDCPTNNACQNFTDKIRRDLKRLADFRDTEALFSSYQITSNTFPTLQAGTFVRSMSTSVWPSWLQTLASEIGSILPTDPLNKFIGCSRHCAIQAGVNCTKDDDCKAGNAADTCSAGFDPVTCFDLTTGIYMCPAGSRVYQYTNIGPTSYKLETDLEQQTYAWTPVIAAVLPGGQVTLKADQGTAPVCASTQFGQSAVCGDGVVGPGEVCEPGQDTIGDCVVNGASGKVVYTCNQTCNGITSKPGAVCLAQYCGDGIIQNIQLGEICDDGANNGTYGHCASNCQGPGPRCGDNMLAGNEQCDLGVCSGNHIVTCRLNTDCGGNGPCVNWNGQYNTDIAKTCSWNCTYPGLYCGDKITNGPEQCDSNSQTGRGACSVSTNIPCSSDTECPANETCKICPDFTNAKGITYQQSRTRGCKENDCTWDTLNNCAVIGSCGDGTVQGSEECDDGNQNNNDACTNTCKKNVCGDGYLGRGEACDFGKAPLVPGGTNGKVCTAPYGGTCNYCSNDCKYLTQTGSYCGDGKYTPIVERCDATANPIVNPAPVGYNQALSLCKADCKKLCPPDFEVTGLQFQTPQPSNVFASKNSGDPNTVLLPACRVGGTMVADVTFGNDVIHFPSPMDVMFLLDNSGSMNTRDFECDANNGKHCKVTGNVCTKDTDCVGGGPTNLCTTEETRLQCERKALCGTIDCSSITKDGIIDQLYSSRSAGNIRIGITEFSNGSKYRTWGNGANAATNNCATIPCYTDAEYQAKTLPANADDSGFLVDGVSNRLALQTIIKNLTAAGGTPTYLGLKQDKTIFDNDKFAKTRVLILLSDGDSNDNAKTTTEANIIKNKIGDSLYFFTVSIPVARQSMQDWADQPIGNANFSINFSYAGDKIGDLLKQIITSMGVKVQLSNVASFIKNQGIPTSWVDDTMLSDEGFAVLLNVPHLATPASDISCNKLDTRQISIRALYASKGVNSGVTISNIRFQYCPVTGY